MLNDNGKTPEPEVSYFKKIKNKIWHFFDLDDSSGRADETEFLPAVLEITEKPVSPTIRITVWVMIALVFLALGWAIFGQVDEVAVAPGKIIPTGYIKTIQAEDKGIVRAIHVKDGQKVKKGQVLIELDPTMTGADLARVNKEIAALELDMDRLTAEQQSTSFLPKKTNQIEDKDIEYQMRLFITRKADYDARMGRAQSSVSQAEAALAVARATSSKYQALYEIAKDKEDKLQLLVDQNAVAQFTLLDQRSKRLELEQNVAAQISEIQRLEHALLQSRETLRNTVTDQEKDIAGKLVDDRKQLLSLQEDVKKAQEKNRLSTIVAPIDGRVNQLAIHTLGGIVTEAQALMTIVPEDAKLEVEAWVANKDIGFVHVGQEAEIKVETFSFQKFGTLKAEVVDISPDAIEDKDKGRVYRAELRVDKPFIELNGVQTSLSPGMSVSAEIKLRQKRIIEFFLEPFQKYQSEGLRER